MGTSPATGWDAPRSRPHSSSWRSRDGGRRAQRAPRRPAREGLEWGCTRNGRPRAGGTRGRPWGERVRKNPLRGELPPRTGCPETGFRGASASPAGRSRLTVGRLGAVAVGAGGAIEELHAPTGHEQDLGREPVAVLAVLAPLPGLQLARDVDQPALLRVLLQHVDQPALEADDPVPLRLVDAARRSA